MLHKNKACLPPTAAATAAAAAPSSSTECSNDQPEQATASEHPAQPQQQQHLESEVIAEEPIVEVMREEVDEALKLAEEWEHKYKEMQRQMSEIETGQAVKKLSTDRSLNRSSTLMSETSDYQQPAIQNQVRYRARESHFFLHNFFTIKYNKKSCG